MGIGRALDPDVVAGRVRRDVDWKGRLIQTLLLEGDRKGRWIWTLLLEGTLDPDVVDGRVGSRCCCWKARWIRTLLMEGTLDQDVVAGRDVESGRC